MEPRWDYENILLGWAEPTVFLGGTNVFDIYVEPLTGWLRLTCGPDTNDNWHWVRIDVGDHMIIPINGEPPRWLELLREDEENVLAYLRVFAPDWRTRTS